MRDMTGRTIEAGHVVRYYHQGDQKSIFEVVDQNGVLFGPALCCENILYGGFEMMKTRWQKNAIELSWSSPSDLLILDVKPEGVTPEFAAAQFENLD